MSERQGDKMNDNDSTHQSTKGPGKVWTSEELIENAEFSDEPPYDGFPSSKADYSTGARRPQIGKVYLSDLPGYQPKVPVEGEQRRDTSALNAMLRRVTGIGPDQDQDSAMEAFRADLLKQTKDRGIAEKKELPRGSLSPGAKHAQLDSPHSPSDQQAKHSPNLNTNESGISGTSQSFKDGAGDAATTTDEDGVLDGRASLARTNIVEDDFRQDQGHEGDSQPAMRNQPETPQESGN